MFDKKLSQLVEAAQAGNREAFGSLVRKYQNLVTSAALARTGDLQLSEDIAQEAFLLAWQKRADLNDPSLFGSWVRGIANNIARNENRQRYRGADRTAKGIDSHSEPHSKFESPDLETSRREQSQELWSFVDDIQEGYREALILYYREGQSVTAVAEQLGLSESAAKQRLTRGRMKLKQEIEERVALMLCDTKPSELFHAGVIAALPKIGTIGTAAGTKVVASKAIAGWASSSMIGIFGGAIGGLLGVGGGWLGTKNSAAQATSEEEKNLLWLVYKRALQLAIGFVVGILGFAFLTEGTYQLIGLATLISTYGVLLVTIVLRSTKRLKQLHQVHGKPGHSLETGDAKPVSTNALRLNSLAMAAGSWIWLLIYASVTQSPVVLSIAIFSLITILLQVWISAAACNTVYRQILYNGRCCLWSSIVQVFVILIGLLIKEGQFADGWDGIPVWAMCGFILVIGIGVSALTKSKAKRLTMASTEVA